MNKFRTLTRVLFKNGAMPGRSGSSRGKAVWLIVAVAFLPLLWAEAAALWSAYDAISSNRLTGALLAALLTAACLAMVLLGILYVISTYYFADDTLLLLTMPIPPYRILAAKFTVVLLFQYWLEILIVLPVLAVFGIRGGNFFYWLNAVLVFAALPLIPTVVCSVISILIMAFSRFFRNKDRVKFLGGLVAIIFACLISIPLQMAGGNLSTSQALQSSGGLMKKAAVLFPSNIPATRAILDGTVFSLLWLAAFLLFTAAAIAVFLLLGDKLYLKGVVGLSQSSVKARKARAAEFRIKKRSAAASIALKDWRLLCRTPAYSLNCLLGAFLVPLILVVTFAFTLRGVAIPRNNILVISLGVLSMTFVSMTNMVSPTAVSRDGKDADLARLIPVRPETQILGKLIPGLGLSFAALIVTAVPVCILFRPDPFTAAAVCVLSAVDLAASNMFGLFFDISFPKLDWDDETIAVKQNPNVNIQLLVTLVALGLPILPIFMLHLSLQAGMIFLVIYNLALLAISESLLFRKGPKLLCGAGSQKKAAGKTADHRKTICAIAGAVIAVAFCGYMYWQIVLVRADVTISGGKVSISAGTDSSSFELSQIKTVYLKNSLPSLSGRNGTQTGDKARGSFIVDGMGRGHVYTENNKGPFLFIIFKNGSFTILNYDDVSKTNSLYGSFKKYVPD